MREWRYLPNSDYQIHADGRVRNPKGSVLVRKNTGHMFYTNRDGQRLRFLVHRDGPDLYGEGWTGKNVEKINAPTQDRPPEVTVSIVRDTYRVHSTRLKTTEAEEAACTESAHHMIAFRTNQEETVYGPRLKYPVQPIVDLFTDNPHSPRIHALCSAAIQLSYEIELEDHLQREDAA